MGALASHPARLDRGPLRSPQEHRVGIRHDRDQAAYAVGEKIARFTLYAQNDTEIVTGGDDRHLDFRVSVRKLSRDGSDRVVLSTAVSPHNLFGRAYLFVILPFHRLGVRALLANAVRAGRV